MENAYAHALIEMIENGPDRPGRKPHEAVALLKSHLEERGRAALLPKIGRAFARLAARESGKTTMTLTVARQKDAKRAIKEVEQLLASQMFTDTDLREVVDARLIGGWRLEGRGILVDNSWKKALLSIYNHATQ